MKAAFLSFFLVSGAVAFGQFKYEKNSNGDPLTEIIDLNGMKQGSWNFIDSDNHVFRTETYKDNVLVSDEYYRSTAVPVNLSAFQQKNISSFTQQPLKDLARDLAGVGNGEIIILNNKQALLHIYFDKVKNRSRISQIDLSVLKNYPLQNMIIFF